MVIPGIPMLYLFIYFLFVFIFLLSLPGMTIITKPEKEWNYKKPTKIETHIWWQMEAVWRKEFF